MYRFYSGQKKKKRDGSKRYRRVAFPPLSVPSLEKRGQTRRTINLAVYEESHCKYTGQKAERAKIRNGSQVQITLLSTSPAPPNLTVRAHTSLRRSSTSMPTSKSEISLARKELPSIIMNHILNIFRSVVHPPICRTSLRDALSVTITLFVTILCRTNSPSIVSITSNFGAR